MVFLYIYIEECLQIKMKTFVHGKKKIVEYFDKGLEERTFFTFLLYKPLFC